MLQQKAGLLEGPWCSTRLHRPAGLHHLLPVCLAQLGCVTHRKGAAGRSCSILVTSGLLCATACPQPYNASEIVLNPKP